MSLTAAAKEALANPDEVLIAAMREVDLLAPAAPAITPMVTVIAANEPATVFEVVRDLERELRMQELAHDSANAAAANNAAIANMANAAQSAPNMRGLENAFRVRFVSGEDLEER